MVHYLYLIGHPGGPIKIGITSSPNTRLRSLQAGCPFRIYMLKAFPMRSRDHAIKHETCLKHMRPETRLIGEWFKLNENEAIECVQTSFEYESRNEESYA